MSVSVVTRGEKILLDRFAVAAPINPMVVDVGANVGEWTLEVLDRRRDASILAIEPQRGALEQLRGALPPRTNVATLPCAVGAERTTLRLFHSKDPSCVQATLIERTDLGAYHGTELALDQATWVDVVPLRELLREDVHVHLMKLDVEGYEAPALHGAHLANVDVIQYEFNDCALQADIDFTMLRTFLEDQGFEVFALVDGHLDSPRGQEQGLSWIGPEVFVAIARDCSWWR